jgi:hypothetical protein
MIKDKSGGMQATSKGGDWQQHNTSMQSDSLARESLSMTMNDISIERIEEQTRRIHNKRQREAQRIDNENQVNIVPIISVATV